jgi:hypothetical protein
MKYVREAMYQNSGQAIGYGIVIDKVVQDKRCPQPLMASVRGKAQYASQQTFGRMAVGPLHVMSNHQRYTKSGVLSNMVVQALRRIQYILKESPPRSLSCTGEQRPLLLFTDGAAEGAKRNRVTCGAVLIDTAKDWAQMFGGRVPPDLVRSWKKDGDKDGDKIQVIGQAELLPVALSRLQWKTVFRHRRVMIFIDNDSARQALIRGWSPSVSSDLIIQDMLRAEVTDQVWLWYGRVPTHSNPADDPSRLILIPSADNDYADIIDMPQIPASLYPSFQ